MPALPLHEAGKYVAGAYVVFVAMILIYVVIMAIRLQRIEREVAELDELAARKEREEPGDRDEDLGRTDAARLSQDAGLEAPRR
jgi:flagellar biosynthesis/type III secretory pathway M-ring protein FliF/YscJ